MAKRGILLAGTDVGHDKLESVLEDWGYAVHRAASGRDALDTGIAKLPEILLTEWVLADQIPGLQVAAALRLVNPSLKIVMTARAAPIDLRHAARELGAPSPFAPPIDPERLREALDVASPGVHQGAGTPVGIVYLGADDAILYANPTGRRFLAATRAGAEARHIAEILSPAEIASMREALDEWVEVWPLADPGVPWQVRSRTCCGYAFLVVLSGEQCLTLLETWPGLYHTDFLVELLLDVPVPGGLRWPFLGRALVIDTSRMFRRLAVQEIERTGTLCYAAADGEEARRIVAGDFSVTVVLADAATLLEEGERLVTDLCELRPGLLVASCGEPAPPGADVACLLPKPWTIESVIYELQHAALQRSDGGETLFRPAGERFSSPERKNRDAQDQDA